MRDDIHTLPISREAKAYARRKGLKAMMRQPKDFLKVNAQLTNPGKPDRFQNYDDGENAQGGKVGDRNLLNRKHETAQAVVDALIYG